MNKEIVYIISSSLTGGAEIMAIESGKFLKDNFNLDIHFVTSGPPLSDYINSLGIKNTIIPMRDNFDLLALFRLHSFLKKIKPEFVHLHMNRAGLLGGLVCKFLKIPSIITAAGMVKNIYVKYADLCLPCSKGVETHLLNNGLKTEMKLLKNCIDTSKFSQEKSIKNDNKTIISIVARLHPKKGHMDLLKIMKILLEDHKNLYLNIIGDGNKAYVKKLKTMTRKLNIEKSVFFLGECNNIKELLYDTDIFVLPSYTEGLPLSILEAFACSLPVVAYDIPGVNEINGENFQGPLLCKTGDIYSMAGIISTLIKNKYFAKKIGKSGKNYINENFDIKNYSNNLREIYSYFREKYI